MLLDQPADSIQQLYEEETWDQIRTKLGQLTATEYTEEVILDWMKRRKDLGESLDEKTDPRILPPPSYNEVMKSDTGYNKEPPSYLESIEIPYQITLP